MGIYLQISEGCSSAILHLKLKKEDDFEAGASSIKKSDQLSDYGKKTEVEVETMTKDQREKQQQRSGNQYRMKQKSIKTQG